MFHTSLHWQLASTGTCQPVHSQQSSRAAGNKSSHWLAGFQTPRHGVRVVAGKPTSASESSEPPGSRYRRRGQYVLRPPASPKRFRSTRKAGVGLRDSVKSSDQQPRTRPKLGRAARRMPCSYTASDSANPVSCHRRDPAVDRRARAQHYCLQCEYARTMPLLA